MMTKYLTTICLVGGGVIPLLVDVNTSHLLNPSWDSHARLHEAWRLSVNLLIFFFAIYLLWSKNKEVLAASLSLCVHFGFLIATILMPFYGGELVGEGNPEPEIFDIPIGLFMFSSMFILQAITLVVLKRKGLSLSGDLS